MLNFSQIDFSGKRVLLRVDFNVPMDEFGTIISDQRIRASIETIKYLLSKGAAVLILSHLGRPTPGEFEDKFSLSAVAKHVQALLGRAVTWLPDWPFVEHQLSAGELAIAENVRFLDGETDNATALAKRMLTNIDVFVMDAFATCHRKHASVSGVATYAPIACLGPLAISEFAQLEDLLSPTNKPIAAIIGGAKISTKLPVLKRLVTQVDYLLIGGGIANTILSAKGYTVGKSLVDLGDRKVVSELLQVCQRYAEKIYLPIDVTVATDIKQETKARCCKLEEVAIDESIVDIGPGTCQQWLGLISKAKSVLWNGAVGIFEQEKFSIGTSSLVRALAASNSYSAVGGGDTLAAVNKWASEADFSYVSTGGGAFLYSLAGRPIPIINCLQQRQKTHV